jgi:hypothetical protein
MNFKSILIVGLSMTTLGLALPAHAGSESVYSYGYGEWFYGDLRVDSLTDSRGDRSASTNTSPTNVQNAEATNISNATNESLETKYSYGTNRQLRSCPSSRVNPKQGAPSIEQAKIYFYCDQEGETTGITSGMLRLVDDLEIQISPKSRPFSLAHDFEYRRSPRADIKMDTEQPVYDIKASFTGTVCHYPGTTCSSDRFPSSNGICFRDTVSNWHCRAIGSSKPVANP